MAQTTISYQCAGCGGAYTVTATRAAHQRMTGAPVCGAACYDKVYR